jgi:hypothetical protein
MGETPEKAFFVKCDAETNPPEVVDAGQLIVEIGLAPVKPAEFVIFRIGQMPSGGGVLGTRRASGWCTGFRASLHRQVLGPAAWLGGG